MRHKLFTNMLAIVLLCVVVIGAGCESGNIFGFQGTDDSNTGDLIIKGQGLLRDGKYAEALVEFNKAVSADSLNSDALFFAAKAEFLASGFSVVELLQDMTTEFGSNGDVPIFSNTKIIGIKPVFTEVEQSKLLRTMTRILNRLQPIIDGRTTGGFTAEVVSLDSGLARTLKGFLSLRDTNKDGNIDDSDLNLGLVKTDLGFELDLETAILTPDNGDDLNAVISDFCEGDQSTVKQIIEDLKASGLLDALGDTSIDLSMLETELENLGAALCEYFVNTGTPGNKGIGDNDNDGRIDEEALDGIDNDGDGTIDEDSRLNLGNDGIDNDGDGTIDEADELLT
ncbi:MAG: hypothetical protein QGI34_01245 [Candidatus Latescibacteria bacterium]|nr:hypothetical protein [Candidatus Latescibacterota bacterium]